MYMRLVLCRDVKPVSNTASSVQPPRPDTRCVMWGDCVIVKRFHVLWLSSTSEVNDES